MRDEDNFSKENYYIGKDERRYYSSEALMQANREYMKRMFPIKEDPFIPQKKISLNSECNSECSTSERLSKLNPNFEKLEREKISMTEQVRYRLQRWQDYYENRTHSTPGAAYSAADEVADAIYQARKASLPLSINAPDPKLNLNVSDESILTAINLAKSKETRGLIRLLF